MADSHIKFGWVRGGKVSAPSTWAAGSDVLVNTGGKFVIKSGIGVAIATDGSNEILGHAEDGARTTVAADPVNIIVDPSAVYRIPINSGTYSHAMQFDTCDLGVTSNVQGANLAAADDDVFIIVDGDVSGQAWVEVMLNQNERGQAGVV